jgi:hypothetical protein
VVPAKLEAPERYRMVLGSDAGRFNDWEKYDLVRFAGIRTTISVGNIRGKPGATWASLARVNFIGAGDEKSRPVVALVIQFDRKTHKPLPYLTRTGSDKTEGFSVELAPDRPVPVVVYVNRPGKMEIVLAGKRYEADLPFEVKGISVVVSGVDAVFEPSTCCGASRERRAPRDSPRYDAPGSTGGSVTLARTRCVRWWRCAWSAVLLACALDVAAAAPDPQERAEPLVIERLSDDVPATEAAQARAAPDARYEPFGDGSLRTLVVP